MLKPFHRPRLWWGLWLLAVMGVVVLSLMGLAIARGIAALERRFVDWR